MTNKEAVFWLTNLMADIGKAKHSDLWHYEQALSEIKEMLESQPERKKGTYTENGKNDEWYCQYTTCNECGSNWMGSRNFCPNCGADMRKPFTIPTEIIESVIGYDD